jgi:hypothetical protein
VCLDRHADRKPDVSFSGIDAEQCITNALILAIIASRIAVWRGAIGLGFDLLNRRERGEDFSSAVALSR